MKQNIMKVLDAVITHTIAFSGFIYFLFFCKGEIYNEAEIHKTIKENEKFIIAMNHESYLDWLVMWAVFKYRFKVNIVFLAKEKLFHHRLWGMLMRHGGCIKVSNEGTKILDKEARKKMKNSIIGIFPEGKRTRDGKLQKFKSGVAVLAVRENIPILPISLNGFFEAWEPFAKFPKINKLQIVVNKLIANSNDYKVKDYLLLTEQRIKEGKNFRSLKYNEYDSCIFDLDSTLTKTNIAELLFYIQKKTRPKTDYYIWLLKVIALTPILKLIDKIYRPLCQLIVYNMYLDLEVLNMEDYAKEYIEKYFDSKVIIKTSLLLDHLNKSGLDIYIVSTNLNIFVKAFSNKFNAKGFGVSLEEFKNYSFIEKLHYLETFKKSIINELRISNAIGVGDSKYDAPIFTSSKYSIIVTGKRRNSHLISGVNNYILIH